MFPMHHLCLIKRVALNKSVIASIAAASFCLLSIIASAETKVIGYIPSWKGFKATVDATDLTKLTHINISFLNPNSSGAVALNGEPVCMESGVSADITYLVQKAHAAGVKVLVSVAGGVIPKCSGDWSTLLQPATRQTVIDNLIAFVDAHELDGIDVDIEGELLTNIDNAGNYTPFIKALSEILKPKAKLLTCATASYNGGMIPVSSISYFDFVNIMSYDNIGPSWGDAGSEQSTYNMAQLDINKWKARGLSKEQLVLGVPFYGYGFGTYQANYNFQDIVNLSETFASQDIVGTRCAGCSYITYNGVPTIKQKTQLALKDGSGVMIWELSQDASGTNSLLSAIHSEIQMITSSSSSSLAISSSNSSSTLSSSSSSTSSVLSSGVSSTATSKPSKSGGGGGGAVNMYLLAIILSLAFLSFRPTRASLI